MKPSSILHIILILLMTLATASCSTTRRIPQGEILYTGAKTVKVTTPEDVKLADGVASKFKDAINVAPNNALFSPYLRHPFPIGLWVYNNWSNPPSGLKHWLYEKLVEEPVLISDVRPEVRVKMLDEILDNNGYFAGSASYELIQGKNPKKATIKYNVNTGPEYRIDTVILLPDTTTINHHIDSIARRNTYLRPGNRYSTDSLSNARINIANSLRNRGYYYFRPEYIIYQADSTINPGSIALRLAIAPKTPSFTLRQYRTGSITTTVNRQYGGGTPDTTLTRRGTLIQMQPSRLRKEVIPECITFREGKIFSVRDMNRTQTYLSRLGIFSGIEINVNPDTTASDLLNVDINCTFDSPLEAAIEANVTSKSNSYLGPGLNLSLTNRNLFGGGEQLKVGLNGTYEWQTGHNRSSIFNSYEVGINSSISFPRLLLPNSVKRTRREINWTRIDLSASLLNRPHYFRMAQFNTGIAYEWRINRYIHNAFTPFKLTYTKLMNTTAEFDSLMNANRAIALSFQSQFIPQMSYNFTFDRTINHDNEINLQVSATEAGNIFWSIYELCGNKGEKKLFNTPFSQFIKGQAQLVWSRRLRGSHWLVSRALIGAAHAYGNSIEVPYSEQFYCGGANSVRAFTVRSIGPGSYRVPADQVNDYFDQTGTFKFEFNVEYRFPIYGPLQGALFIDTGNVWLLNDDPQRPGGLLKASSFLRDLAVGTGAGLRFDIGMLVIRGDLGIGIHAPYQTGRSGYYNMESFGRSLAFHLAIGYPF